MLSHIIAQCMYTKSGTKCTTTAVFGWKMSCSNGYAKQRMKLSFGK